MMERRWCARSHARRLPRCRQSRRRPLPRGADTAVCRAACPTAPLQAHFEFSSAASLQGQHTDSFPTALLSLAQRYGVRQLEVALTQGRWVCWVEGAGRSWRRQLLKRSDA